MCPKEVLFVRLYPIFMFSTFITTKLVAMRAVAILTAFTMVVGLAPVAHATEAPAEVRGCTNPTAVNFNPAATTDDGSCVVIPRVPVLPVLPVPPVLCLDDEAINFEEEGVCEYETVGVGGYKWEDANEDEYWDEEGEEEEFGQEGITITISAGEFFSATTTDEDGWYEFQGLTPGMTYTICEEVPEDYYQTYPNLDDEDSSVVECDEYSDGYEVTPEVGDEYFDLDFGNARLDAELTITYPNEEDNLVSGFEIFYADFYDDDETEDEIEWSVYEGPCDTEAESVFVVGGNVLDFNDEYEFEDGEIAMYLDTTELDNGEYCLEVDPVEQGEEEDLFAQANFTVENPTFTIEGYKFEDTNKNGMIDEGDAPVAGWTIYALDTEDVAEDDLLGLYDYATVTDSTGYYSFTVPMGIWLISEEGKAGWEQVLAESNDLEIRSRDEEDEILDEETEVQMTCMFLVADFKFERKLRREYRCDFLNVQNVQIVQVDEPSNNGGGTRVGSRSAASRPAGQVLGTATSTATTTPTTAPMCEGRYLLDYMRIGDAASSTQVLKLQIFLNAMGITTPLTGEFGTSTDASVRTFQKRYPNDVLSPWGISDATGYVFKTTRATINNLVCPGSEPAPKL
jgi:peptidoglycan hydrolase-like protein with peptidoglycan-binding domain